MQYLVVEIQRNETISSLTYAYEERNEAISKYHSILAAASVSSVPVHSAVILTEEGNAIKSESYNHEE